MTPANFPNDAAFGAGGRKLTFSKSCALDTQNYAAALNDFNDYFLLGFRYYETGEEQKQVLETLINHPKRELLSKMLIEVGELSENFNDPLGELYEP